MEKGMIGVSEENKIVFKGRDDIKMVMVFQVSNWEGDFGEVDVEIKGNDDIVRVMERYMEGRWDRLFEGLYADISNISEVDFEGLHMVAKNEKGTFSYFMDSGQRGTMSFKHDVIDGGSTEKIKKIRDILDEG